MGEGSFQFVSPHPVGGGGYQIQPWTGGGTQSQVGGVPSLRFGRYLVSGSGGYLVSGPGGGQGTRSQV